MKSFNEIYEQVYKENNDEMSKLKFKKKSATILFIVSIVIAWIFLLNLSNKFEAGVVIVSISSAIILITAIVSYNSAYRQKFKTNIIYTFVKNVDKNLTYYPNKGISTIMYRKGEFERFDEFSSEDSIEGILDDKYKIKMAEVHAQNVIQDSEGNTSRTTIFRGIFGNIECIKDTHIKLKVRSDKGVLGNLFKSKSKIEMDSSEFEKYFDITADDKIGAMQILTSDLMALMIEFREESNIRYEFTLNNNQIYLRFHIGDVFEPKYFKDALDYDTLKNYYDIINFVFGVAREINKAIENTEI